MEILSHEFTIKVSVKYNYIYCVAYIVFTSNNVAKLLSCCAYFNWNFWLFNPSSTSKDALYNILLIQITCIHLMEPFVASKVRCIINDPRELLLYISILLLWNRPRKEPEISILKVKYFMGIKNNPFLYVKLPIRQKYF